MAKGRSKEDKTREWKRALRPLVRTHLIEKKSNPRRIKTYSWKIVLGKLSRRLTNWRSW